MASVVNGFLHINQWLYQLYHQRLSKPILVLWCSVISQIVISYRSQVIPYHAAHEKI